MGEVVKWIQNHIQRDREIKLEKDTVAKAREFPVTRTLDNQQLGLSVLIESLKPGETVLFREVTDEKPGDVVETGRQIAKRLGLKEWIAPDGAYMKPMEVYRALEALAAIRKGKG